VRVWPGGKKEGRRRVRSVRESERPVMNLGVLDGCCDEGEGVISVEVRIR
jgi:hypothetical protein